MHCLSLPSLVAEGGEDAAAGCVGLVTEALRCAGSAGAAIAGTSVPPVELMKGCFGGICLLRLDSRNTAYARF